MNQDTAKKLNSLLNDSAPFELSENCVPCGDLVYSNSGATPQAIELERRIKEILAQNIEAVVAEEISDAARERRKADVLDVNFTPYNWKSYKDGEIPWHFTRRLWKHCREQIEAVISAYNKERKDEYERYRLACEQGVAVPPEKI